MELPACVAWMVQVPTAINVTIAPETVQTEGAVEEKVTARLEDALALNLKGATPTA